MNGWVGFDLDGTLAVYDGWKGIQHIGLPIESVVNYAKQLLDAGIEIRIVTARYQEGPEAIGAVADWAYAVFGQEIRVTDRKDMAMVALVDDRAIAVERNTGKFLTPLTSVEQILWHHSPKNPENPAYDAAI